MASFCPPYAECTRCSRISLQRLLSAFSYVGLPAAMQNFSFVVVVQSFSSKKFSNLYFFFFLVGQNPAVGQNFYATAKGHNFFLFGWLAVVDYAIAVVASRCLFLAAPFFAAASFGFPVAASLSFSWWNCLAAVRISLAAAARLCLYLLKLVINT